MTKSTITRERIQRIIRAINSEAYDEEEIREWLSSDEIMELSRMALAAMDSEPVAIVEPSDYVTAAQLVGEESLRKAVRELYEGALRIGDKLYRHAQPAPEYPEVLPCSVLLEPGLRFGKGIKTSTMLAALARRAVHESDMAALSQEERAEFQARIEDFKALIAQPVPVVPQDVLEALQKVARIRLDLDEFDGDRRGIADCLGDAEEALIEVVNRRAAMLAAAPQSPGIEPATVPGKWIPVSDRMPEGNGVYFGWDGKRVLEVYCFFGGFSANQFIHGEITHWMPLPADPQEVNHG
ncbi:DUF551 domain-containing protein [Klebsiella variicola]|uniref:DUF551 domain-containing protein n=1 Tax=Klebsiella variicola TaxID=244366 RepID=UPI000C7D60E0|nr:DUF551 domain-containing protein [Klebsiella variicola]PLC78315.1 hypothetical protein B6I40_09690 [Klebsiella variicola]